MRNMFQIKSALAVLACTAMLSILFFSSCDKEEEKEKGFQSTIDDWGDSPDMTEGAIVFAPKADTALTKVSYEGLKTKFDDGDLVGVYAVAREGNKKGELLEKGNYADNVRYKYVAEKNRFMPVNEKETIYNNPAGVLDLYVYYPYNSNVIDGRAIPHYVFGDQTTDYNFKKSDLMAATCLDYKEGVAVLNFRKMMACLEVIVNKRVENGVTGVTVKNRDNGSLVSLLDDKVETIDNKRDIRMMLFEETDAEYRFRAYMPAQTAEADVDFAVISLRDGQTKEYTTSSAIKLEKGLRVEHDITLQSRIKVLAGAGGTVSVTNAYKDGNVYKDGSGVTATAQAIPGWVFKNWQEFGASIGTNNPYTFVSEKNRTITAIFERGFFRIGTDMAFPNGQHPSLGSNGCSVTPSRTYVFETKAQLTANAGAGFYFSGWTDGNGSAQRWETAGPSDMTYTAQFSRNSYRVSGFASPGEGGSVSGGGSVLFGDPASLTATASSGYHFTGWSNGSASSTINISQVNDDMSFTAFFEADPVTPPDPVDPDKPDPDNPDGGGGGETPDPPGKEYYCIYCNITGQGTVSGVGCDKPNGPYTLVATPAPGWSSSWTTKQVVVAGKDVYESVVFTKNEVPDNKPAGSIDISVSESWAYMKGILEVKVNGNVVEYINFEQMATTSSHALSNMDVYKDGNTVSFRALDVQISGGNTDGIESLKECSTYPASITLSGGRPYSLSISVMR